MTNTSNITIKSLIESNLMKLSLGDTIQWFIICTVLFFQVVTLYKGIKEQSRKYGDILNSMGIFGTFLGICIGLWYLNPDNITESIPGFIGSMKIAFITSVSGLLGSLILNYNLKEVSNEDAGLSDVIDTIRSGDETLFGKIDVMGASIKDLSMSINGKEEGSLLNQIVLLRSNINDKFTSLTEEFRQFAQLQAENNTKALVEAIREVIGDFNAKINEQFGENFKELNNAVGDLVVWQENYKEILESTYDKINIASQSIEHSKTMLNAVQERFTENMKINDDVKVSLEVLGKENEEMEQKMEAFRDLSETAKDAFPIIKSNIENLTEGFTSHVDSTFSTVESNLRSQQTMTNELVENIKDNVTRSMDTLDSSVEKTNNAITSSLDNMQSSVDQASKDLTKGMEKSFADAIHNIEQLQQNIASAFESTMMQLSDAQRQEMERSLRSLGNELASVSQKFVDDYAELTSRMRTVVAMAEG